MRTVQFKKKSLKSKLFGSKSPSQIVTWSIVFIIFSIFAFSYLYILIFMLLNGLKSHNDTVMNPWGLPTAWHFENFVEVFKRLVVYDNSAYETNFWGMLFNSLAFSIPGTIMNIMFEAMAAYATSKYKFKGSGIFYAITIFMMTFPIYGSSGAAFKMYANLGLIDSYAQILMSWGAFNANYLFFYTVFNGVSNGYKESAEIDGAGEYTIFFKVMLPQVSGLFVALFILGWIASWNDYGSVLIYLKHLPTIAGGIYLFKQNAMANVANHILYMAYFIAAIPPIVLYACFNKTLTTNISLGGLKE